MNRASSAMKCGAGSREREESGEPRLSGRSQQQINGFVDGEK